MESRQRITLHNSQGKERSQENPTPPPERQTNKKLKTDDTIDTANRYDSLPVEDPIDEKTRTATLLQMYPSIANHRRSPSTTW
ncbi:hypothetical protein TNCV_1046081 [Trichonephila clavipes]|nr:hypothetical protein TNCV_1046081 [Trichonephila clavipes]